MNPRKKISANLKILLMLFLIQLIVSLPLIAQSKEKAGFILSDDNGRILASQNSDINFTPASILKILTSLAAIECIGPDYHFHTEYLYIGETKDLYLKGYADPLFISEEIEKLCSEVIERFGIQEIQNIILDHSYFSSQIQIPGKGESLNPYDAPVGALCANFNTVMFKWDHRTGHFISGESQTPLLPIFFNRIKNTGLKQGRIILTEKQSRLYAGQLVKYFLKMKNVEVSGNIFEGEMPAGKGNPSQFVSSFKMTDVIQKLLKYSNNFIANQLMLTIGTKKSGEPATLEKGVKALNIFARRDLDLQNIQIKEGSGLSRDNRISPGQMLKILIEFTPYYGLLSIEGNDHFKTGTLSDVRTRAGYFEGHDGRLYPYVIMVNGNRNGYGDIYRKLGLKISEISKK